MSDADPLLTVARLPGVAEASARARAALDPLLLDRRLRTHGAALAAEAALRNAHASATLEGAEVPVEELQQRTATSPVLRVASGVLEAQTTLRTLHGQPARQVWATLAAIAGAEYLDADQRGRPRRPDEPLHDPLHLGLTRSTDEAAVRVAMLVELLGAPTGAPAIVVAALAHGELLSLQPFGAGNGVVARGFAHHLLAERGLDPDYFAMMDVGLLSLGRASYVRAVRGYDQGGAEGVSRWVMHIASAFERGAQLTRQALDVIAAR